MLTKIYIIMQDLFPGHFDTTRVLELKSENVPGTCHQPSATGPRARVAHVAIAITSHLIVFDKTFKLSRKAHAYISTEYQKMYRLEAYTVNYACSSEWNTSMKASCTSYTGNFER